MVLQYTMETKKNFEVEERAETILSAGNHTRLSESVFNMVKEII